jgi:hypothetical protein
MADLWYYTSNGQRMEPVTRAELERLAASGLLQRTDLVWTEGMPQWVRADAGRGLFPKHVLADDQTPFTTSSVREASLDPGTYSLAGSEESLDESRPRRRLRRKYDDDPLERRPRRRQLEQGLGVGVKVALWVGGGLFALVIVILAVWLIVSSRSTSGPGPWSYSVNLGAQRLDTRYFSFQPGTRIEFTVRSDHNSDVDILVYDRNNALVTGDESIGPNSFCVFLPARAERYKVEIRNLGPGFNRSHVTIREVPNGGIGPGR